MSLTCRRMYEYVCVCYLAVCAAYTVCVLKASSPCKLACVCVVERGYTFCMDPSCLSLCLPVSARVWVALSLVCSRGLLGAFLPV